MANLSTKPTCLSLETHPSPRASFLLSLLSHPPLAPLSSRFIRSVSCYPPPRFSSSSFIGEFVPVSDWTLFSVPPLMTPPLTFRTRSKCDLTLQQPLLLLERKGKKVLERHLEDRVINKQRHSSSFYFVRFKIWNSFKSSFGIKIIF